MIGKARAAFFRDPEMWFPTFDQQIEHALKMASTSLPQCYNIDESCRTHYFEPTGD